MLNPVQRVAHAEMLLEKARVRLEKAQARVALIRRKSKCRGCSRELYDASLGRPRVWCDKCRHGEPFRKWFRATYGEKNREYQRMYRREYRRRQKELTKKAATTQTT